jgi:hypothetical protein
MQCSRSTVLDIQNLTRIIADSADEIHEDTQRAITRLFSPSPTFNDVSYAARSSGLANSAILSLVHLPVQKRV